jgi:hypothetical protein
MKEIKAPLDRWCYYYVGVHNGEVKEELYFPPSAVYSAASAAAFDVGLERFTGGVWTWIGLWQGPSGLWYVYKDHEAWLKTIERDSGGGDASEVIDGDNL